MFENEPRVCTIHLRSRSAMNYIQRFIRHKVPESASDKTLYQTSLIADSKAHFAC